MSLLRNDVYSVKNSFNQIDNVKKCKLRGASKVISKERIVTVQELVNNKNRERHHINLKPEE